MEQATTIFEYDKNSGMFKRTTDSKLIKAGETYIEPGTEAVYVMDTVFGTKEPNGYFAYDPYSITTYEVNNEFELIGAMKVLKAETLSNEPYLKHLHS